MFTVLKAIDFIGNKVIDLFKSLIPIVEFIGECITNLIVSIKYLLQGKINLKNVLHVQFYYQ